MSTDDPNFIGAWWLGFLVIGFTALIGLLPLFFFPRHMTEYYRRVDTQPKEKENEPTKENTLMSTIKGMGRDLLFRMKFTESEGTDCLMLNSAHCKPYLRILSQ